jgi:mannose-6-phosphate isomerase-like protein (cupin superfamily)
MRRVVTGHTPAGKPIFASDTDVEERIVPMPSGAEMFRTSFVWAAGGPPTFPDDGTPQPVPAGRRYPPVGGISFAILSFPPHTDAGGMHITDTVDVYYVLSGEVCLELESGSEEVVRAGDTLVQNGTMHAWHNRSSEPCRLVAFMVGARRK